MSITKQAKSIKDLGLYRCHLLILELLPPGYRFLRYEKQITIEDDLRAVALDINGTEQKIALVINSQGEAVLQFLL